MEGYEHMREVERSERWRRWIALLACATLLAPLGQIAAQDGAGAILYTRAVIVFPAAIQFVIGVDAPPGAITRAALTVAQDGAPLRTFELTDAAAVELRESDTSAELIVTWALDSPPTPRPFAPLAYAWTIELDSGVQLSASGEIEYTDPRFVWQTAGEPPLTLYWHNARLNGQGIRAELEPVLAALRDHAGETPAFTFAIYDPDAPLCPPPTDPQTGESAPGIVSPVNKQVFDCGAAQHTRAYGGAGIIFIQRPTLGYTDLRDLLAARMARDTYQRQWDAAGREVPAWFAAGLAALYRPRGDLAGLELVRAALEDGSALPLDALASEPSEDTPLTERALWEAQSAALVRYLMDRSGPDAPFEVARAVAEGRTFDEALAALDDTLPQALGDTWEHWIASDEAERAAAWTPYEEPEPVPPAAPTATQRAAPRPTSAPSATSTVTPTDAPRVTPTLLGNVAPQVIVVQPTTAPPGTPTHTPLPPGSLPSVTPRPAPAAPVESSAASLDQTEMLGVALLVAGGALLLIAIGLLLRQR